MVDEASACESCGTENRPGARFCKACGAALVAPESCPACGTDLPDGGRFCSNCGTRVVGARPATLAAAGPDAFTAAEASLAKAEEVDSGPRDETKAQAEIEAVRSTARRSSRPSGIFANALIFVAAAVGVLVIIQVMNPPLPEGVKRQSPSLGGGPPMGATARPAPTAPAAGKPSGDEAVSGEVVLGEGISPPPGTPTLFVVVRPAGAPDRGPPLAVLKAGGAGFPQAFRVGQGNVMLPGMTFEGEVDVRARLDADGNVMTKAKGDLRSSQVVKAAAGQSGLRIVLDERLE